MASIETAIRLIDRVSQPMQNIYRNVQNATRSFDAMHRSTQKAESAKFEVMNLGISRAKENMDKLSNSTEHATSQQQKFNDKLNGAVTSSGEMIGKVKGLIGAYLSIKSAVSTIQDLADASNVQREAETKLETIMKQRMGASEQSIQSMKDLASQQQKIGVIGDEVQMAGQQQLATFLKTDTALKKLTPAMNNLAAQQNGVNVTSQNMVSIGNMMGKVMQGSTSALTRVGITFTDAQEKALKYGNEQQRAATLAQVITDNVGKMNQVLAQTPQGQIQQVKNDLGDLKEVAGVALMPALVQLFQTINANLPLISNMLTNLGSALNVVVTAASVMLGWIGQLAQCVSDNWAIVSPILAGILTAVAIFEAVTIATNLWAGAQAVLNAIMAMNPVMLVVAAVLLLIALLFSACAAINKVKGTSLSAMGLIGGAVGGFVANVINKFIMIYNIIAEVVNFFANVWDNPIASVEILFMNLATTVLGYIEQIASGIESLINKIPGVEVDITSGISNLKDGIKDASKELQAESGWTEVIQQKSYVNAENYVNKGYNMGKTAQDTIAGKFKMPNTESAAIKNLSGKNTAKNVADSAAAKTASNTGKTAANTAAMKDSLDVTSSNLKYIRDFATQRAVNRYSNSTIKIDMTNHNNIGKDQDIDGIVTKLKDRLTEEMTSSAEGVMA